MNKPQKSSLKYLNRSVLVALFFYFEVFGLYLLWGNQKSESINLLKQLKHPMVHLSYETGLLFQWFGSALLFDSFLGVSLGKRPCCWFFGSAINFLYGF